MCSAITEESPLLYNPSQSYAAANLNPSEILKEIYAKIAQSFRKLIEKIQEIVKGDFLSFNHEYDNHRLHDLVTEVTLKVRNDPKVKASWESFLMSLDKRRVSCTDGQFVSLDFNPELRLLKELQSLPTQNQMRVERLTSQTLNLVHIALQIDAISRESFASTERNIPDLTTLLASAKEAVFIAKDTVNEEVLGFAIVRDESQQKELKHHIMSFARKASAAKRGVANMIFKHIFANHIPPQSPTVLEVRKSNEVAVQLYKKFRFEIVKTTPAYYHNPTESAHEMVRKPEENGLCIACVIL